MNAPLCFLDCETTGLSLDDDIWEIARNPYLAAPADGASVATPVTGWTP